MPKCNAPATGSPVRPPTSTGGSNSVGKIPSDMANAPARPLGSTKGSTHAGHQGMPKPGEESFTHGKAKVGP